MYSHNYTCFQSFQTQLSNWKGWDLKIGFVNLSSHHHFSFILTSHFTHIITIPYLNYGKIPRSGHKTEHTMICSILAFFDWLAKSPVWNLRKCRTIYLDIILLFHFTFWAGDDSPVLLSIPQMQKPFDYGKITPMNKLGEVRPCWLQ